MAKSKGSRSDKRGRSAITGRFIKQTSVQRHPRTTLNETVKRKRRK